MSKEIILGCYTPSYEPIARQYLIPSLTACQRDEWYYEVRQIPDRGSWLLNNAACQLFLLEMHRDYPTYDFLYIDVDGVVREDPWPWLRLFRRMCDFAAYAVYNEYFPDGYEPLTGTLYLPAGSRRKELLKEWISRNEEFPKIWDQRNLGHIVRKHTRIGSVTYPAQNPMNAKTVARLPGFVPPGKFVLHNHSPGYTWLELPIEFCCIFDLHRKKHPDIHPIVEHFQASRRRPQLQ